MTLADEKVREILAEHGIGPGTDLGDEETVWSLIRKAYGQGYVDGLRERPEAAA